MVDMQDRVALVTGGGSGIGRAIVERLAGRGATLAVVDINEQGAEQAAGAAGGDSAAFVTDVADFAAVTSMVEAVKARYGRIDVLVNCAGWDKIEPFLDNEPALWDKVIGINLYGVIHTCHKVLPIMVEQGYGRVVNIGSDAGRVGSSGEAVYSATKGGIIAMSKTLAREMARYKISINTVCPGPSDTPLFEQIAGYNPKIVEALKKAIPFRRLGTPDDLAGAVAFFASDEAAFVTGQTLSVSGGLTMA